MNPNGKRVASPFDDVKDKCDVASCINVNVELISNVVGTTTGNTQGSVHNNPDNTMDLDAFCEAEELFPADDKCDNASTSSTNPTSVSFSNKKQAKNKLNLSSQGYDKLMQGKNLEFFHHRSMSFMRVCPLMTKTIQTGTPLEEISRPAEVLISSPLPKEQVQQHTVVSEKDMVAQQQVVFQITKKKRISSDSAQVNKVSVVQFEFVAVRESKNKKSRDKVNSSRHQNGVTRARASVHLRDRFSISVDVSHSLCRNTKKDDVAKSTGETEIVAMAT